MADKQIGDLTAATGMTDGSLFVIEQSGAAKNVNWGMLKNYIQPNVVETYSTSSKYNVGDIVVYNDSIYRCNTTISTAEAWTASHWSPSSLSEGVSGISDCISAVSVTSGLSVTNSGVTAVRVDEHTIKLYGTASATRRLCFMNGQNTFKTSTSAFEKTIDKGLYLIKTDMTGAQTDYSLQRTYTTYASAYTVANTSGKNATYYFTGAAMVAIMLMSGRNYGTSDNPSYFSCEMIKVTAKDDVARAAATSVSDAVLFSAQTLTDAEAGQARTNIDSVGNDTLYKFNFYDAMELGGGTSGSNYQVTYTRNADNSWTIDGTATGNSFRNIISSASAVPRYIIPGRKYKLSMHGGSVPVQVYLYHDGTYDLTLYTTDATFLVPANLTGIIVRFYVEEGATVSNETVKYTLIPETVTSIDNYYSYSTTVNQTVQQISNTYSGSVSPTITTDTNGWLASVDTNTADETGKTDMTPAIMAMLNSTGYCHLGEGIFYVSGNIDMPEYSTLVGCGRNTIVRLLQSVSSGYVVKMFSYNTLENVTIDGARSAPGHSTEGTRNGILFQANYDGNEGATQYTTGHCMMSNVWVRNFTGSGIKCHNTSKTYREGLHAVNVFVSQCWCGLNIDYISEFNKFVNLVTSLCNYGCRNNGGNNVFTSCTFYGTQIAFYVDGTKENAAHGTITGCTFCHSGSNTGSAITMNDVAAGFVVSDSQIWYNSVDLTNCTGVSFVGCEFGRGTTGNGATINITNGNLILFSGCMFMNDVTYPPDITITNNTKVKWDSCYGSASGNAISA